VENLGGIADMIRKAMHNPKLTPRWHQLRQIDSQTDLLERLVRFNVVSAGRRSGKTEILGKRMVVVRAFCAHRKDMPQYYIPHNDIYMAVCAPTRDQAKRLYWKDLKAMIPPAMMAKKPSETSLIIELRNGVQIHVIGMDKPERMEGTPWSHVVMDEYASMRPEAWQLHVRPSLSDRGGSCDFIGVPEGTNHFYKLYTKAGEAAVMAKHNKKRTAWRNFHWTAEEVLPVHEIIEAKNDLDPDTYNQEYNAKFINFTGRAYYSFTRETHCAPLEYNPKAPLIFCFDFNVEPGCAAVCQEQHLPGTRQIGTGVIGEVWIPRGSNTQLVCRRLIKDWQDHYGKIVCYGDSTGGSRGSAKVLGSDWQIIKEMLHDAFDRRGQRVFYRVPKANPRERDRVNAVNARLKTMRGDIRLKVDAEKAPHVVEDLEGVVVVKGGSGELDKTSMELTHACFAGDVLVRTPQGVRPLQSIAESGTIERWDGTWVPFFHGGLRLRNAALVDVVLSNGDRIRCTPWHRWLTPHGWRKAEELTGQWIETTQSRLYPPPSKDSTAASTGFTTVASISRLLDERQPLNCACTKQFGSISTAQSQSDTACITSTGIEATTKSPICALCLKASMHGSTWKTPVGWRPVEPLLRKQSLRRRDGMQARKDASGIDSITSECTNNYMPNAIATNALTVTGSSGLAERSVRSFVRTTARHGTDTIAESMTKRERVPFAAKFTEQTSIGRTPHAAENVERLFVLAVVPSGRADAYCVTVSADGCFALANGAIVSNSDAIGYYVNREFGLRPQYKPSGQSYWK
jgi:hypothetical protein